MTPITYLQNLEDFPIGIALLFRYYIKMGDHVL